MSPYYSIKTILWKIPSEHSFKKADDVQLLFKMTLKDNVHYSEIEH